MAKRVTVTHPPVALVYLRVSTLRQATDGVGLDVQEAKCKVHAERMGWPVAEIFSDEGISGKDGIEDRPGLAALLERVKSTPGAVVVVYSVSRLARRQKLLWGMLDDRDGLGLLVSSATENFDTTTPMGRAMLGMIAVWSQLEADMCSQRTKAALAELKAQGKRLGRPTMGETSAETVRIVQEMFATGFYSQTALADELNRLRIPTVTGQGKWWRKTVQAALATKLPPK